MRLKKLKAITMRNFLRTVWRLIFKRRDRAAREAKSYYLSRVEICPCDKFTGKPQQYFPRKGWRLLAHIGDRDTAKRIDQTHDLELDEDVLERIDFFACLFGTGTTE
jgi:hypothetical protein